MGFETFPGGEENSVKKGQDLLYGMESSLQHNELSQIITVGRPGLRPHN
jgi:hypothetical protein